MSKQSNWITVDALGTVAYEIPKLGCLVRHGRDAQMVYVPDAAIQEGKLVGRPPCLTHITFSGGGDSQTDTASLAKTWVADAGDKLERKLQAKNLTDALNKFIQKTWKVTPTVKQLTALRELIRGQ